jgi:heterodisulfide reductase subunit C2
MPEKAKSPIAPNPDLAKRISEDTGQNYHECYQCEKCSAGCPMASEADILPHQMIRLVQLGAEDRLLNSRMIWLCVGCETCSTRCPNELAASKLADALRRLAVEKGIRPAMPDVLTFHQSFVDSLSRSGRLHEIGMLGKYKLKSGNYFQDMKLGMDLFRRGKIRIMPSSVKNTGEIRRLFSEAEKKGGKH